MKLRNVAHGNSGKKEVLKRIGIVVGIIALFIAAVQFTRYITGPQIQYRLQAADCSSQTIAARNKAQRVNLKSCVLIVSATNLQNKSVAVDYAGVGGGPLGGSDPLIRIYSGSSRFCYAFLVGEGRAFAPKATNLLTLRCGGVQNPPKDYDQSSDTNPSSIIIDGHSKTTIKLRPIR